MTKRIEGYATLWQEPLGVQNATFMGGKSEVRESLNRPPAVLFIGENGEPPKVMLEKDVKAVLGAVIRHVEGYYFDKEEIIELVAKYGIDLTK